MFNIKNIFKKESRKNKLLDHLKEDAKSENNFEVNLSEEFIEQSTSISAQLKKTHFSFLEFIENTKTSLVPNELFIIEVLEEIINVSILSKKAHFLDIKYLKKYTYQELHETYKRIVGKEVDYDRDWYESIENILTIVSYDTIYSLPKKIVIIENNHSDFVKVETKTGRFKDKKLLDNLIQKEVEISSGYKSDDVYKQITQRPFQENKDKTIYIISMIEKEYFDNLNESFNDSGLSIKRLHSIKSSLYSSFFIQNENAKMRVHVVQNIAYSMEKYRESGFEYQQFDLSHDYSAIELVGYTMDEVIISGSGHHYETLKQVLVDAGVKVRTFSYLKDLNRAIIRLEEGVELNNSYSTIIGVAYHELFKINFSSIRLGVSKNITIYEIMYNNLNVLPFMILFIVMLATYGTYFMLNHKYETIKKQHLGTTKLVNMKKSLNKNIALHEKNIKNTLKVIKKMDDLFSSRETSLDALALHEIAQKLPDDMIITSIDKTKRKGKGRLAKKEDVITLKGKCFQEISLLKYMKSLDIDGKNIYLVRLHDSRNLNINKNKKTTESIFTKFMRSVKPQANIQGELLDSLKEDKNLENIKQTILNPRDEKEKEIAKMNLEKKKIYFSDTLNNSFELEIR